MAEMTLQPWVLVNSYMREDYRLLVAGMAARAMKTAEPELQQLARQAFDPIPVKGARSFWRADIVQQRAGLAKAMPSQPQLTALVIVLWAEAAKEQIGILQHAGELAGLEFDKEWNWQKGIEGFYDFEEIPLLSALADQLGEHANEQNQDHLKLAALWLGRAVTNPEALKGSVEDGGNSEQ